jgi:dihydropteroate synthase
VHLLIRHRQVDTDTTPLVMGVLNVTPDSFSDGNEYFEPARAVERAFGMISEGADIIDVGPESTRPGAQPVSAAEQIARAIPVIEAIREKDDRVAISIDTRLASVARAALSAGADMVNDVSALRDDPEMVEVVAASGTAVVLMHIRGVPADMQRGGGPQYDDVVGEVAAFLDERRGYAVSRGIDPSRIIFDPGIGFGKRVEHNLLIMRHLDRFVALGQPVMVGASRKSFIGSVLGIEEPKHREAGSLACVAIAVMAGAAIVRVHDVRPAVEVVRLCSAIRQAGAQPDWCVGGRTLPPLAF